MDIDFVKLILIKKKKSVVCNETLKTTHVLVVFNRSSFLFCYENKIKIQLSQQDPIVFCLYM